MVPELAKYHHISSLDGGSLAVAQRSRLEASQVLVADHTL